MKTKKLLLIVLLLQLTVRAAVFDAKINGINYRLDTDSKEATVKQLPEIPGSGHLPGSPDYYVGDIVIPDEVECEGNTFKVTAIAPRTFSDCTDLTSVVIGNNVNAISDYTFSGCRGLSSVVIGSQVSFIGTYAFHGCISLPSIVIPDNVESIGTNAFQNCMSMTSVTLPSNLSRIDIQVFQGCSSLTSITIPAGVKYIMADAFKGCASLSSVVFPEDTQLENINGEPFIDTPWHQNLPDGVCYIGKTLYKYVGQMPQNTQIEIKKGITVICENAFKNCREMTGITIPNSVTHIGDYAFYGCSGVTSVTIPESVSEIGWYAFDGCFLANVQIKNPGLNLNYNVFSDRTYQHAVLYIPVGTWGEIVYGAGSWYRFNHIKESATATEELSRACAYNMMDGKTFAYAVYDILNDEVRMVPSASEIDESNPNHCWQIVESQGDKFLYNIGAKKYAKSAVDGSLSLVNEAVAIEMNNTEDGIAISKNSSNSWNFVMNKMVAVDKNVTAVGGIKADNTLSNQYYSLGGQRVTHLQKGVTIVHTGNGRVIKVAMK